jgi:hypothetical protein
LTLRSRAQKAPHTDSFCWQEHIPRSG